MNNNFLEFPKNVTTLCSYSVMDKNMPSGVRLPEFELQLCSL